MRQIQISWRKEVLYPQVQRILLKLLFQDSKMLLKLTFTRIQRPQRGQMTTISLYPTLKQEVVIISRLDIH